MLSSPTYFVSHLKFFIIYTLSRFLNLSADKRIEVLSNINKFKMYQMFIYFVT